MNRAQRRDQRVDRRLRHRLIVGHHRDAPRERGDFRHQAGQLAAEGGHELVVELLDQGEHDVRRAVVGSLGARIWERRRRRAARAKADSANRVDAPAAARARRVAGRNRWAMTAARHPAGVMMPRYTSHWRRNADSGTKRAVCASGAPKPEPTGKAIANMAANAGTYSGCAGQRRRRRKAPAIRAPVEHERQHARGRGREQRIRCGRVVPVAQQRQVRRRHVDERTGVEMPPGRASNTSKSARAHERVERARTGTARHDA